MGEGNLLLFRFLMCVKSYMLQGLPPVSKSDQDISEFEGKAKDPKDDLRTFRRDATNWRGKSMDEYEKEQKFQE